VHKRELAAALVDGRVELKVQLVWSRAATHCGSRQTWPRLKVASRSRTQPAWNLCSHVSTARWPSTAAVAVVAAMAAATAMEVAAAMQPCFLPVRRGLTSGFKGAKHIKHTRRAGDSCDDPVGDSNGGSGGGGGEAVVLVKEGRVEASPRGARSEKSVLPLLLLLPLPLLLVPPLPLLLLLLLPAVDFPAPLAEFCAAAAASGAAKKISSALGQAARRCSATRCGWGGSRGRRRRPELPGYRAPLLRICSCIGQIYFFLEILFLSVPVLLVKSTTIRILRKVAIAACF
jgi:hypothetical protein